MNIHSVTADMTTHPGASAAPVAMTTRVLDAALAVFTERTYAGTAVPAVAERAGIGVGTIYRSFAGKEEVANAVYRRAKLGLLDELVAALAPLGSSATSRDRVAAVWAGLAAYAEVDPAGFAFLEHQQHAAYLDADSLTVSSRVDALAADLVRAGQAAGEIRPGEPELLVALAFGAFVGLSKLARSRGTTPSAAEVALAGDAVWHLLAPLPPPRQKDHS
jgi:AcrR family transcriptional regulator